MIGFYNYTVILTYVGMLVSFAGVGFVLHDNIHAALICLLVSGFCDMFDGKIASTMMRTVREKRFGIQIDSLSDLICFGCLPAMIVYVVAEKSKFGFCVSGIYLLCALIRLAYFNVDEEERQNQTDEGRKVYLGLPVTTVALIVPPMICLGNRFAWHLPMLGPVVLLAIALGFISPFQIKKTGWTGKVLLLILGVAEFLLLFMR